MIVLEQIIYKGNLMLIRYKKFCLRVSQLRVRYTKSGILIFCDLSVFFSFQSPKETNQITQNFLQASRIGQDELDPRRLMVDKLQIGVYYSLENVSPQLQQME